MQCLCLEKEEMSICDKKYYLACSIKKGNCIEYEDLLPKCINDGNYFALLIYLFLLIYNFKML